MTGSEAVVPVMRLARSYRSAASQSGRIPSSSRVRMTRRGVP